MPDWYPQKLHFVSSLGKYNGFDRLREVCQAICNMEAAKELQKREKALLKNQRAEDQ